MSYYIDYRFKFPLSGLPLALKALDTLRLAHLIEGNLPENMLGDPRDFNGVIITDGSDPAFKGSPGRDLAGDSGCWYIAIRTITSPDEIPFNPSDYGLQICDPDESASVLGTWA